MVAAFVTKNQNRVSKQEAGRGWSGHANHPQLWLLNSHLILSCEQLDREIRKILRAVVHTAGFSWREKRLHVFSHRTLRRNSLTRGNERRLWEFFLSSCWWVREVGWTRKKGLGKEGERKDEGRWSFLVIMRSRRRRGGKRRMSVNDWHDLLLWFPYVSRMERSSSSWNIIDAPLVAQFKFAGVGLKTAPGKQVFAALLHKHTDSLPVYRWSRSIVLKGASNTRTDTQQWTDRHSSPVNSSAKC